MKTFNYICFIILLVSSCQQDPRDVEYERQEALIKKSQRWIDSVNKVVRERKSKEYNYTQSQITPEVTINHVIYSKEMDLSNIIRSDKDLNYYIPVNITNNSSKTIIGIELERRFDGWESTFGKHKFILKPNKTHKLKVYIKNYLHSNEDESKLASMPFNRIQVRITKVIYANGIIKSMFTPWK